MDNKAGVQTMGKTLRMCCFFQVWKNLGGEALVEIESCLKKMHTPRRLDRNDGGNQFLFAMIVGMRHVFRFVFFVFS